MTDERLERLRRQWRYSGAEKPSFAVPPAEGQESVWDYPRPPRIERMAQLVEVRIGDDVIARTRTARRVLETGSPPTYYIDPRDIAVGLLVKSDSGSFCEWKGTASYYSLKAGDADVGWYYPDPFPEFEDIRDFVAFYPARVECYLDGVRVKAQSSPFYGGWVTPEIVGPFRDEVPDTLNKETT